MTTGLEPGDYCPALFCADLYPDHAELFFVLDTADVTRIARRILRTKCRYP